MLNCVKYFYRFILIASICANLSVFCGQPKNSTALEWEYAPKTPIDPAWVPQLNTFQASPNETLIFGVLSDDVDKRRLKGSGDQNWQNVYHEGPYETVFKIEGDAEFHAAGSNDKEEPFPEITVINLIIVTKADWTGEVPIVVTATMTDKAPDPEPDPNSGTKRDPAVIQRKWTVTKRTKPCPTQMTCVGGTINAWVKSSHDFTYKMGPDVPGVNPDYAGQSIQEKFGPPTPLNWGLNDLNPGFFTRNPGVVTLEAAANILFGGAANGTFVVDSDDEIVDTNKDSMVSTVNFKIEKAVDEISYKIVQTFCCAGVDIKTYTVTYRRQGINKSELNKTGP